MLAITIVLVTLIALCIPYPWVRRLIWVTMCAAFGVFVWTLGVLVLAIPVMVSAVIVVLVLLSPHRPRSTALALMALDRDR